MDKNKMRALYRRALQSQLLRVSDVGATAYTIEVFRLEKSVVLAKAVFDLTAKIEDGIVPTEKVTAALDAIIKDGRKANVV